MPAEDRGQAAEEQQGGRDRQQQQPGADVVARGLTNAEIAKRHFLSAKTVRNHVSNAFGKLQVAGRAEAVAQARDAGLGSD